MTGCVESLWISINKWNKQGCSNQRNMQGPYEEVSVEHELPAGAAPNISPSEREDSEESQSKVASSSAHVRLTSCRDSDGS